MLWYLAGGGAFAVWIFRRDQKRGGHVLAPAYDDLWLAALILGLCLAFWLPMLIWTYAIPKAPRS